MAVDTTKTITPREAIEQARYIASLVRVGGLDYDQAKKQCQPLLDIANKRGAEIAKKFKKTYHPITFTGLAR